jgi:hypothetical protein
MARGKKTGGRLKGAANVKTREIADRAAAEGITPLEYMLKVMRDEKADEKRRDDMAKGAAPYIHPRLQTTEISGKNGGPITVKIDGADAGVL